MKEREDERVDRIMEAENNYWVGEKDKKSWKGVNNNKKRRNEKEITGQ